ncbi:MAG TPA: hypothetical protein VJN43_11310 [Bryobacteraceae bacterium]|nr:hypothetical protein [Bryobacteraceae bacterium]
MARTTYQRASKAKKSYTLSPSSVEFLEQLRKKRHAPSTSSVLDEILQALKRGRQKKALERAVAAYYDSLTDEDAAEEVQWGDFALGEFPAEPDRS